MTGRSAPEWAPATQVLEAFDAGQIAILARGLFGDIDVDPLVAVARGAVGGSPRRLVQFAVAAVAQGAVVHRRGQWVIDVPALEAVARDGVGSRQLPHGLSAAAVRLGAVVAMAQPVQRRRAAAVAQVDPALADLLIDAGLIEGRERLSCTSGDVAAALVATVSDPEPIWRGLASAWLSDRPVPWGRLGWALARAEDREAVVEHGPRCVASAMALDVGDAVALAARMVALASTPELVAAQVDALVQGGDAEGARRIGEAFLAGSDDGERNLPALLALARLEDAVSEDPERILGWTRRAHAALGDGPAPAMLHLVEARAYFRARDLATAEARCAPLCADPPDPDDPEGWLAARGLHAQIRAAADSPQAGLVILDGVPDAFARGSRGRALFEGVRGLLLWYAGRPRRGAEVMERAASMQRALSTVDRARMQNNAALCWYVAGDVERAVAGWERALLGFERIDARVEAIRVQVNLCQGFRDLGRWQRAVEAGQRAVEGAREHSARGFEAVALGNLGDVALWRRRYAQARHFYDAAQVLAEAEGLQGELLELDRRRAELAALSRTPDALEQVLCAEERARDADAEVEVARCQAIRALVMARQGRVAEARRLGDGALEILRRVGDGAALAVARLWVGEAHLALGNDPEVRRLAQEVLSYAGEFARAPLRAWAERLLTWTRAPSSDEGLRRLERLTELDVRIASHARLDEVLDELARGAMELIDAERAFVLLQQGGRRRWWPGRGPPISSPRCRWCAGPWPWAGRSW